MHTVHRNRNSNAAFLSAIDSSRLELTISPTEKCNFRCVYCYEDFAIGAMQPSVSTSIIRFIERRVDTGLSDLSISWFGGEPLLRKDIAFLISSAAKSLTPRRYESGMTTNGYLLDINTLKECIESGITYFQVSIDLNEEIHNTNRPLHAGKGSFNRIRENLIAARASSEKFHISIRVHCYSNSPSEDIASASWLKDEFYHDERFSFDPQLIRRLGGSNDDIIPISDIHGDDRALSMLCDVLGIEHPVNNNHIEMCYAAKANAFTIRPDGRVGKCTVALNDERNIIGRLDANGRLLIDNKKHRPWIAGLFSGDRASMACPLSQLSK